MSSLSNAIERVFPDGTYQLGYSSALSGGEKKEAAPPGSADTPEKKEAARRASVSRAIKTVFDLARSNDWDLMTTYTFDPQKVDSFSWDAVCETMKLYNRRLRRLGIKYIQVPELHESGRIHLHGVQQDPDGMLELTPALNYYTQQPVLDAGGRLMYDIVNWEFGWAKATQVDDNARSGMAVVKYIMKYMSKALDWIPEGKKRYFASQGLTRPEENRLILTMENDALQEISRKADYRRVVSTPFGPWVMLEIHGENNGEEAEAVSTRVNKIKTISTDRV